MRKFFTILAAAATLLCMSSCKLDSEKNYFFAYEAYVNLIDKTDEETVTSYLKETLINDKHGESFFCDHYTAMEKSLTIYVKDMELISLEYMYSFIKDPDDSIMLIGALSSDKSHEVVALTTWDYNSKQKWEEESK